MQLMQMVEVYNETSNTSFFLVLIGAPTLTACGRDDEGLVAGPKEPIIIALQVTPNVAQIPVDFNVQYKALAEKDNHAVVDVTTNTVISWSSSDSNVATIDTDTGIVTGVAVGTVTITASGSANGTDISASAELTVTPAAVTSVEVTPKVGKVTKGKTLPYTATAFFNNGSSLDVTTEKVIAWSSSNTTIATIDNKTGVVTGQVIGTVEISASAIFEGITFKDTVPLRVVSIYNAPLMISETYFDEFVDPREYIVYTDEFGFEVTGPTEYAYASLKYEAAVDECKRRGKRLVANANQFNDYMNSHAPETDNWPLDRIFWTSELDLVGPGVIFDYRLAVGAWVGARDFAILGQDPNAKGFVVCED